MLRSGTQVDRYVIQHLLGRGGMALVYAVKHQVLGTRHALKVLHTIDPAVRERLVREGRVQARLDPAYVVPVTDVLEVNGAAALLMPLVEGCSLAELLEDHRPSEAEVAALFRAVVAGVDSAHAAGVIHRDLKPANVLLELKRGVVVVRVADFGLARPDDDHGQTRTGLFMGTPAYASPEQIADTASVDARADLWSLGVMLFELLTGRRPFQGASVGALLGAVAAGVYEREALPEAWRPLVDGLLQTEREQRTASAEAVATALAGLHEEVRLVIGSPVAEVVRKRVDASQRRVAEAAAIGLDSGATMWGDESFAEPSPPPIRHNLPTERDAFVGRAADLATLHDRLAGGAHLVSVLGIGGTGKTRLVTHYAWQHLTDWPGGVWFCDLSEARSVDGIAFAVARALDVPLGKGDPIVQLGHAIAGRGRCLVVLDNFEQVARYARETVGLWLDRASEAAFVVTTREVLGVRGEVPVALAPLEPVDSAGLFLARAQVAKQGFTATADDTDAIEALVALLDHLPLAIELAAARVRVLPPQKLLSRMGDRFRVLTSAGGRRDRQATLRATLDWSWDLLDPWEQSALAQISVFEGGFDLEAAEAVVDLSSFDEAPWAMDAVQALVDKSLVRTVGDDRFDLLVSVQEYATERLAQQGTGPATVTRHGLFFGGYGTPDAVDALDGHGGVALRLALGRELDNLVAGCSRAVLSSDGPTAVALLGAAWAVMALRGPVMAAVALAERVVGMPGLSLQEGSAARRVLGGALRSAGRGDEARAHFDAVLAAARETGDRRGEGVVLGDLGTLHLHQGRIDEARAHYNASLALAREVGDRRSEGIALGYLGILYSVQGRMDEARAHYDASLVVHLEVGNRRGEGNVHGNLGMMHADQSQRDEARPHHDASLAVAREQGDRRGEGHALCKLGLLLMLQGRLDEARAHYDASLAAAREVGDRRGEGGVLGHLGQLHQFAGETAAARAHLSEALEVCREVGYTYGQPYWLYGLALLAADAGRLDEALQLGEEAVAVAAPYPGAQADALTALARVYLARDEVGSARDALTRARALDLRGLDVHFAAVDALVAVAEGDRVAAERALAQATADPSLCPPGTEDAQLVARARAGLEALDG